MYIIELGLVQCKKVFAKNHFPERNARPILSPICDTISICYTFSPKISVYFPC